MDAPSLEDTMPDNERLMRALKKQMQAEHVILPYTVICKMADVLRETNFSVRCVIGRTGSQGNVFVYDIFPKDAEVVIGGLAIDIGTTTVSALLIDMISGDILGKASSGNGQIRYGADVINRIIESAKPGGRRRLQKAIIDETINPLIQQMCRAAKFPK